MPSDLERAVAFEQALRERCAERVVPFRFGRAFFNDTFPLVWDLNVLRVEEPPGPTAEELAAEADRLHGEAGQSHRRVSVAGERAGEALADPFRALGWRVDRFLVMGYRGTGERVANPATPVEEVDAAALRPLGVASAADLYSDGRTAQVEDVATLPEHRGRGHATAVVLRAVEEALATGHDFVFLVADAEDWPKELYVRLGFAPLGRTWTFLKLPV